MNNPQGVRRATPDDFGELTDLAMELLAEGALQPVSRSKIALMVARCIAMEGGIAGVISGEDGIEASIGLEISQLPYSDADHLTVRWLGAAKQFRRANHGAHLMGLADWAQKAISEAAGHNIPLIAEVATTNELEPLFHCYSRSAYQIGATFSFGFAPTGTFSQRKPGDDPYGQRLREARNTKRVSRPPTRATG